MEIIKPKNNYSANSLEKRLLRMEKILLQLTGVSGEGKGSGSLAGADKVGEKDFLSSSALPLVIRSGSSVADPAIIPIRSGNNTKTGGNGLFLSQGQIIAELAAAIARISQRNL